MTSGTIRIVGARQNNLRDVDVEIPRNRLVAITGVSGSGKSSLAFDTLFREGQRRFLETLSAYARQFLGRMEKPDVESIDGLSPAIAVDQKAASSSPRSTVGTLTEVFDHLRVLFARAGTAHCPGCHLPLQSQTRESIAQKVVAEYAGIAVSVLAPLVRDRKGAHRKLFVDLARRGFIRVRVNGDVQRIEDVGELERYKRHRIEVVVDRLRPDPAEPTRLREALDQALELGDGEVIVAPKAGEGGEREERALSTSRNCPGCGAETPPLEPRLFSFNSPHGACPSCDGLGVLRRPTEARLVADPTLSIRAGALAVTRKSGGAFLYPAVDFRFLEQVTEAHGFDLDTPWKELPRKAQKVILYGAGGERYEDEWSWGGERGRGKVRWQRRFRGVIPAIERAVRGNRKHVVRFLSTAGCNDCKGTRLRPAARAVLFGGASLAELLPLPVAVLRQRLDGLALSDRERRIARDLLTEVARRLDFLSQVGLEYLTLDRGADTLSGGEAQRIRLAAQLSSGLQGVLYVLDEPSIGLHALDHARLLGALQSLRDGGNTVVVVEHDENTLRAADHLIDIGPGAGQHGGHVVASGTPAEVALADSPTARFLRGELEMPAPDEPRAGNGNELRVRGARAFNLKDVDVCLPLGALTVIAGVSGSGKSTLMNRILLPAVLRNLEREGPDPGEHDRIDGLDAVGDAICIDASPIGRTPRSNPATYTGALSPIRDLFASLPEARMRGYDKSRFSFNVKGGRCEACGGAGAQLVELQFLAPVTVPCDECGGHRFQQETLEVRFKGSSIADVLEMTVEQALAVFEDLPKIARPLRTMTEVGLSYLTLGQPSTTLSGGEAQRIKLVKHLHKRTREHTLYLLDEPTTGLHPQDVQKLLGALQALVDAGHTVVVIEHDLNVVRAADHVIDLGPGGGEAGGHVVASGTPQEVRVHEDSCTGAALRGELAPPKRARKGKSRGVDAPPAPVLRASDRIEIRNARTHNLKHLDVSLPRDALTVITGPSGSGKSSLALDTIHTEGRRRFVESLSTYARQFLGSRDRPPVDFIEGLGPSVAVEAGTSRGHPRSTVATTTEIHDHLRVLFARAGTARCPEHGRALEHLDAGAVARRVLKELEGQKGWIAAPIFGPGLEAPEKPAAALRERAKTWVSEGFLRILVGGVEHRLDAKLPSVRAGTRVDLVIDRLSFSKSSRARIAEAVEQAEALAGGLVSVVAAGKAKTPAARHEFSTKGTCSECGFHLERVLEPRHFSFNTHAGACETCDGLGAMSRCDPELLVDRPERALVDGAIGAKFGRYLVKGKGYYEHLLRAVAKAHRIDLERPFEELNKKQRDLLLLGKGARDAYRVAIDKSGKTFEVNERFSAPWPGLCGHVDAWHGNAEDPEWATLLESVMASRTCRTCHGERLRPEIRAVTVGRKRLPEVLSLAVTDALVWLRGLKLSAARTQGVEPVLGELDSRLGLLERVGLGYVTLDRPTHTLSGGEARRVRLSASLGSRLVGVCYVLDEPTVGLHPSDVERLTDALIDLKDGGNTVLVVEHDESLMERADCIIDMGPGAGRLGGQVVAQGTPREVAAGDSLTGKALRGELTLVDEGPPASQVSSGAERIGLQGARLHNLRSADFEARLAEITGVCGPSGSGKSTLVIDTLVPALRGEPSGGRWRRFDGRRGGRTRTVVIDATPIGRTPASVPATYTGLMQPLRELFARTPEARMRGYGPAHFSFNSSRGRCEACEGRGAVKVEMQFLADLWLTCDECEGRRYLPEVLDVRWRGHSIADVLDLPASEALTLLDAQPKLRGVLETLCDVGLGYMSLGQSSTTLSGGEAQRVKLASELHRAEGEEPGVLILDEPSTGLHASDVTHLARVLRRLAAAGNAVILIEHHTGLLTICDRLVELGPGGGAEGGRVVALGTPVEMAGDAKSLTGPYLRRELKRAKGGRPKKRRRAVGAAG
jgi:excinuclease ABC subunit A